MHFVKSCAFFGHRYYDYEPFEDKLEKIIENLINLGVTEFYCGERGYFDAYCRSTVAKLRKKYPQIRLILVLSYRPNKNFVLPTYYDESVYLLEEKVPLKFAICHTNRELIKLVDCVVVAVCHTFGGAFAACTYANRLEKKVINILI